MTRLGKTIPVQAWKDPRGFQEAEDPRFQDIRHVKVVRLSALRNGRLYLPGNISGTHFCWGNRGNTVVKVLCYKSEGRWFVPSWCQWVFL